MAKYQYGIVKFVYNDKVDDDYKCIAFNHGDKKFYKCLNILGRPLVFMSIADVFNPDHHIKKNFIEIDENEYNVINGNVCDIVELDEWSRHFFTCNIINSSIHHVTINEVQNLYVKIKNEFMYYQNQMNKYKSFCEEIELDLVGGIKKEINLDLFGGIKKEKDRLDMFI